MDLQVYYSKSKATTYFLLDTVVDYQKLAEFAKIIGDDHQVPHALQELSIFTCIYLIYCFVLGFSEFADKI
jgi:hypothetical protein